MRRHGVRLARDEELDVIRRCVERFEGKSSLATFDALAKVQRDRIFVVTGEHDEAESVCFPVAIDAVPSALIERDPILRACRERVAATDVVVNRFWFTFEGYQDFGPRMTALMFAGPPLQMSLPPCRFVVFAVADPDRWLPLNAAFGLTHVEGPPPNDPRIVLAVADLDKIAPSGGSREDRARILFLFHARNFAEMSSRAPTARPSRDVFFDGVRDALPLLRRPLELGQSILLQSAIIAATTDPAVALVQVFHDALDELGRAEGYREDAEVLRGSYFGPSAKQEAVAAGLKLPFGTFRHRLRRATTRLTELLWQRELATRSGDS